MSDRCLMCGIRKADADAGLAVPPELMYNGRPCDHIGGVGFVEQPEAPAIMGPSLTEALFGRAPSTTK